MDQLMTIPETVPAETIKKIDDLNRRAWEAHITQPKLGLELSSEAKRLSEENSYSKGLAYAIRNMGVSNRFLSNLETALTLSFQALNMFKQIEEKKGKHRPMFQSGPFIIIWVILTGNWNISQMDYE